MPDFWLSLFISLSLCHLITPQPSSRFQTLFTISSGVGHFVCLGRGGENMLYLYNSWNNHNKIPFYIIWRVLLNSMLGTGVFTISLSNDFSLQIIYVFDTKSTNYQKIKKSCFRLTSNLKARDSLLQHLGLLHTASSNMKIRAVMHNVILSLPSSSLQPTAEATYTCFFLFCIKSGIFFFTSAFKNSAEWSTHCSSFYYQQTPPLCLASMLCGANAFKPWHSVLGCQPACPFPSR